MFPRDTLSRRQIREYSAHEATSSFDTPRSLQRRSVPALPQRSNPRTQRNQGGIPRPAHQVLPPSTSSRLDDPRRDVVEEPGDAETCCTAGQHAETIYAC